MVISIILLTLLFVVTLADVAFYALFTDWRGNPAGRSLMLLLVALLAIVGYTLFSRFIPDVEIRRVIFQAMMLGMIAATAWLGRIMFAERFRTPRNTPNEQSKESTR